MKKLLVLLLCLPALSSLAQNMTINTDGSTGAASAMLDVKSSNKGLLIPRIAIPDLTVAAPVATPAVSLLVYNTNASTGEGYYYWSGSSWTRFQTAQDSSWSPKGNNGILPTQFLGTTDAMPLRLKVGNLNAGFLQAASANTAFGVSTLNNAAPGDFNTAFGNHALDSNTSNFGTAMGAYALFNNVTGFANTAAGFSSLYSNKNGNWNTAVGTNTLKSNASGSFNTAVGGDAMISNISGADNVAIGSSALYSNTSGYQNTAVGLASLALNTTGNQNTALGSRALHDHRSGDFNTAIGYGAMYFDTTGNSNTATGYFALYNSRNAYSNTANGFEALLSNRTGFENTAMGFRSLAGNVGGVVNTAVGTYAMEGNTGGNFNASFGYESMRGNTNGFSNTALGARSMRYNADGHDNTAVGGSAMDNNNGNNNVAVGVAAFLFNQTGSFNTVVGYNAGSNSGQNPSNYAAFGNFAGHVGGNSNTIEIGNSSVGYIGGQVGWSVFSDQRIKDEIRADVPGLDFISKLKPVTYRLNIHRQNELTGAKTGLEWEGKYDIEKTLQTGFLAQEVEAAAKQCGYSFSGVTAPKSNTDLYSIQYAAFVVPLVKAVQEQQAQIEALKKEINELKRLNRDLPDGRQVRLVINCAD